MEKQTGNAQYCRRSRAKRLLYTHRIMKLTHVKK